MTHPVQDALFGPSIAGLFWPLMAYEIDPGGGQATAKQSPERGKMPDCGSGQRRG
jgi:hypothetical protein